MPKEPPPATIRRGGLARRRTPGVESPRKVLLMLLHFSEERPTASIQELATAVDVPMSTAYRYLALLRELGLLQQNGPTTYSVAPRIIGVARAAERANDLLALARPVLESLSTQTNETVMLVKMIAGSAVCVEKVEADRPVRLSLRQGQPLWLHRGASGKVLLAYLPKGEREDYLTSQLTVDPALRERIGHLRNELEAIAERGWAMSHGEIDEGIWACSAAIRSNRQSQPQGALTVAGPSYRIGTTDQDRILQLLTDAATQLALELEQRVPAT